MCLWGKEISVKLPPTKKKATSKHVFPSFPLDFVTQFNLNVLVGGERLDVDSWG
jgi:hypothetical protein